MLGKRREARLVRWVEFQSTQKPAPRDFNLTVAIPNHANFIVEIGIKRSFIHFAGREVGETLAVGPNALRDLTFCVGFSFTVTLLPQAHEELIMGIQVVRIVDGSPA